LKVKLDRVTGGCGKGLKKVIKVSLIRLEDVVRWCYS